MSNFVDQIGVQSYCFRNFKDNATVASMVRDCGLDRIELCAVHCDFNKPETFDEVIGIYKDAGVAIGERVRRTVPVAVVSDAQRR